ncbi:MAG: ribosome biogenesis GTPase Der [Chloroflexi bacterium]|nr:ribosome biogenesis GTPase Der [Chloroflexota bacterium]|tara:strand:- start:661 stop:2100 length:1440 start_codon:yes stop_codon:yes gene_type:complete
MRNPDAIPLIAIVGRPNVGKSSLFNALVGRRSAIVAEETGTTRDRLISPVEFEGHHFLLADTGGLVPQPETEIEAHIEAQVNEALEVADAILLVTDVRTGPIYADQEVARKLRRTDKPVVVAVNKADNLKLENMMPESYALGLSDLVAVSALHRRGLGELMDSLLSVIDLPLQAEESIDMPRFAIVGRPNVGKSAIANAILNEERSIVSDIPGTTRDALDSEFVFEDSKILLIDTAGIRRRGAIEPGVEKFSVLRSVTSIHRSDVAILVLDANQPATDQDLHIAGQAAEAFKSVLVVVNKWDLVETDDIRREEKRFTYMLRSRFRFIPDVPIVFTSAINKSGIDTLLTEGLRLFHKRNQWVDSSHLSRIVTDAISRHLPPSVGPTGSLKLYRVKQDSIRPPTFVFYVNNTSRVHFSYERYLANTIRDEFAFYGVPLKIEFRGKGGVHVIGDNRSKASARKRQSANRGNWKTARRRKPND